MSLREVDPPSSRANGRPATGPSRKVGRPAKIDRNAIADAVLHIGLGNSSMKAVADHLGVSVPGLYHHVRNRKELLLLAAQRSMARMRAPTDRGQHWAEWLREWGRYSHGAFVDEPEVFAQYLRGAISLDLTVEVMESVIGVLSRQGFTPAQAMAAWDAVGRLAVGAAADHLREQAAVEGGHPLVPELRRLLAEGDKDALPGVRAVVDGPIAETEDRFEDELTSLLVGIAVRRGEPWEPIADGS
jgi:AcrR family transcriptional regulator